MKTASCLCGKVAFELRGPLADVISCHCKQCRKQTGHFWASTHSADTDINFIRNGTLTWYRSSDSAQRGFCSACGSTLFWKRDYSDTTSVCAGAIDDHTELKTAGHIYCSDASDYYEIPESGYRKAQT
jgi:hypothetical protein